ncbi:MAG: asparagine synthase (glutamine-hydrolyzing) [Oscillospiraceae bacterium]|nr:asparagine synthase (glutamine-hydrolyzing) [Oscillospiraceae bacterium]
MRGFCGFTGEVERPEEVIRRMSERIAHRGPGSGYYTGEGAAMGWRLPAAMGCPLPADNPESGGGPLFNEDKTLVLCFDGRIYNCRALREELEAAGHIFAAGGDAEAVLHGYEQWGEELLLKLRGSFAFSIYNTADGSLFIARDFFGVKPMQYARLPGGGTVFASEIKAILAHPLVEQEFNEPALDKYLSFQYSLPEETFFKGIYTLPPAHFMRITAGGEVELQRYWEAVFDPDQDMTLEQAVDGIEQVFAESVETCRDIGGEAGCFLSGGVDSSWVSSYFGGRKAFTVGFDMPGHYNETDYAAELAAELRIDHTIRMITEEEYAAALPRIQYLLDQPLADPACVALYFAAELAAGQVDAALSGEGADEFFGGYRIYHEPLSLAKYQKLPRWLRRLAAAIVSPLPAFKGRSFLLRGAQTVEQRFIGNARMFGKKEKAKLLRSIAATDPAEQVQKYYARTRGQEDVTRMQSLDIHTWGVGDILLKADRMSMAHALEIRTPFLDREVFALAAKIPPKHHIAGGTTKYAMRQAAKRHLPEKSTARPKLGFPVPIRVWLRQDNWYARVAEAFQSEAAQKFFYTDELMKLLDRHKKGKADNSRKIWTVYMFLVWYGAYFGES